MKRFWISPKAGMRQVIFLVGLTLAAALFASPAFANSVCVAGNLSSVMDIPCNIGPLQFTFYTLYAASNVTDLKTLQVFDQVNFTPNNFDFTPTSDGFALTLLNGPQLMTQSPGFFAGEDVFPILRPSHHEPGISDNSRKRLLSGAFSLWQRLLLGTGLGKDRLQFSGRAGVIWRVCGLGYIRDRD